MIGDSLLALVFDRQTIWKRIENDQPMCNDFVWIADRLSGYFNSSRRATHMNMEPVLDGCVYCRH
jgi:hypothetical protein